MKRCITDSLIPGFMIGTMLVVGYETKYNNGFSFLPVKIALIGLMWVIASASITGFYSILDRGEMQNASYKSPLPNRLVNKSASWYWISAVTFLILWAPLFLAFYPGIFAYDAQWQYSMYITGNVSTHQPIIHTYMLGWLIDTFYKLTGSINKGIAAYTLAQMLIMALGCAFVPYKLHEFKCKTWVQLFSLVFYGLFPVIGIFVFSSTKDSFFAVVVADLVALLLELVEDEKKFWNDLGNCVLLIIFAFFVLALRNNAVYPVALMAPFFVLMIIKGKGYRKKAFATLGITLVLFLVYRYPLTDALSEEEVSKAEMLSVPCQQIVRVYKYHYDELDACEIEDVERFFDNEKWYGYYVPEIADATKGSLRFDEYEEATGDFWELWRVLFKKYPNEYVNSILENTYAFWYPWPHYIIYSFGGEGYTPIVTMQPGEQNSKMSGLLDIYKNFENGAIVQSSYGISWIFAPATYMYVALVVLFYVLRKKGCKALLPFGFLILLWCTYLLGPVAMVRYALYLYFLVPVWIAWLKLSRG